MGSGSVSRLARAQILPPDPPLLFPSPPESVRGILVAGRRHLARTRIWRIGGVRASDDRVVARLGWETQEETDLYDPEVGDFQPEAVIRGRTVTFVVRLTDLAVVYERRRAGLSEQDFATGLRILLRAFDGHRRWIVAPVDSKTTFANWARGVDRVSRFRFRAEGSHLRDGVRSSTLGLLLRPRAGQLTVDFRSTDGMDVDDEMFRELVQLAETGVGNVLAVGRRSSQDSEDVVKAWESTTAAERVVQEVSLNEEDTDAAAESRLLRALTALPNNPPW
jgi:hypothetical protein